MLKDACENCSSFCNAAMAEDKRCVTVCADTGRESTDKNTNDKNFIFKIYSQN
jgi:hypothetical protein